MSFYSREIECDAYKKELEALSADELMTRFKIEGCAGDPFYKVEHGKLLSKSSGKWIVVYDGHDWHDKIKVIIYMVDKRRDRLFEAERERRDRLFKAERERRDRLFKAEWKAKQEEAKTNEKRDSFIFFLFTLVLPTIIMIVIAIVFATPI